jgi:hypothetical protein
LGPSGSPTPTPTQTATVTATTTAAATARTTTTITTATPHTVTSTNQHYALSYVLGFNLFIPGAGILYSIWINLSGKKEQGRKNKSLFKVRISFHFIACTTSSS